MKLLSGYFIAFAVCRVYHLYHGVPSISYKSITCRSYSVHFQMLRDSMVQGGTGGTPSYLPWKSSGHGVASERFTLPWVTSLLLSPRGPVSQLVIYLGKVRVTGLPVRGLPPATGAPFPLLSPPRGPVSRARKTADLARYTVGVRPSPAYSL